MDHAEAVIQAQVDLLENNLGINLREGNIAQAELEEQTLLELNQVLANL